MIRDIINFGTEGGLSVFQIAEVRDRAMLEEEVRLIKTLTDIPFCLTA